MCIVNSVTRWESQSASKSGHLTQGEPSQFPMNGMLDGSIDHLEQIAQKSLLCFQESNPRICNKLKCWYTDYKLWDSEIESPLELHYSGGGGREYSSSTVHIINLRDTFLQLLLLHLEECHTALYATSPEHIFSLLKPFIAHLSNNIKVIEGFLTLMQENST
jgi:hypothetical protein